MRRKSKGAWLAVAVLAAGPALAASTFYATCGHADHDAWWDGPIRDSREGAQADCNVHLERYPTHGCAIEEVVR